MLMKVEVSQQGILVLNVNLINFQIIILESKVI